MPFVMSSYQPRVYTASKLHHAKLMMEMRLKFPRLHFTARWPLMHGQVEDGPEFAPQFWQDDFEDLARANCVVVFAQAGEHLRGALVEAGMAIALGLPVIVAGDHPDYGTWQYHPLVTREPSLEAALSAVSDTIHRERAKKCP